MVPPQVAVTVKVVSFQKVYMYLTKFKLHPIIAFQSKKEIHCLALPSSLLFPIWHQLNLNTIPCTDAGGRWSISCCIYCPVSGSWIMRQWFTRSPEILECFTIKNRSLKPNPSGKFDPQQWQKVLNLALPSDHKSFYTRLFIGNHNYSLIQEKMVYDVCPCMSYSW